MSLVSMADGVLVQGFCCSRPDSCSPRHRSRCRSIHVWDCTARGRPDTSRRLLLLLRRRQLQRRLLLLVVQSLLLVNLLRLLLQLSILQEGNKTLWCRLCILDSDAGACSGVGRQ